MSSSGRSGPGWERSRMSLERPSEAWIPMWAANLSPAEVGGAIALDVPPQRPVVGALWSLTRVRGADDEVLSLTAEITIPGESALEVIELAPDSRVWILADVDLAIERALAGGGA